MDIYRVLFNDLLDSRYTNVSGQKFKFKYSFTKNKLMANKIMATLYFLLTGCMPEGYEKQMKPTLIALHTHYKFFKDKIKNNIKDKEKNIDSILTFLKENKDKTEIKKYIADDVTVDDVIKTIESFKRILRKMKVETTDESIEKWFREYTKDSDLNRIRVQIATKLVNKVTRDDLNKVLEGMTGEQIRKLNKFLKGMTNKQIRELKDLNQLIEMQAKQQEIPKPEIPFVPLKL